MSTIGQYLVLNKKNYFAMAEEYINLKPLFKIDTFYEKLSLFMKLIGNILLTIIWKSQPLNIGLTIYQAFNDWKQYLHYLDLKKQINEWKELVHSAGGPYISTNDETYQSYVYADGMQRLHNSLFGFSKESTKCLK